MASLNMDFLNTPAASAFPGMAGGMMGLDDVSNGSACVEGDNFVLPAGEDVSMLCRLFADGAPICSNCIGLVWH
jgi:hypothetical protein